MDEILQIIDAIQEQLQLISNSTSAATERFTNIVETFQDGLTLEETNRATAMEAARKHIGDVTDAVQKSSEDMDEAFQLATGRVAEILELMRTETANHICQPFHEITRQGSLALQEATIKIVDEQLHAKKDEIIRTMLSDLRRQIDRIMATLRDAFDDFRTGMLGEAEEAAMSKQASKAVMDQLKPLFDELKVQLERVRGLAEKAGASF